MKHTFSLLLLVFLVTACSTSKTSDVNKKNYDDPNVMVLDDNEVAVGNNLESFLNRTAGVRVNGSGQNATVQIRGVNSFGSGTQPLFVVNGSDVGQSYSNAAGLVQNMKIKSVEVLKGSDASLYGVRGAGGVVIIKAE